MRLLKTALILIASIIAVITFNTIQYTTNDHEPAAFEPVNVNEHRSLERLSSAIQIKTISGQGIEPFKQLHQLLSTQFSAVFATLEASTLNEGTLVLVWHGKDTSLDPIVWLAHQDVVPVEAASIDKWRFAPFSGTLADGLIWGRGTLDDKGSVMAIFEALDLLVTEGFRPNRTMHFVFGHDEEIGGELGAKAYAQKMHEQGTRYEYALDEGSVITRMVPGVNSAVALISTTERGYLSLKLSTTDTGGHSSTPSGYPAIFRLANALSKLAHHPFAADLSDISATMKALGNKLPWYYRAIFANEWLFAGAINQMMQSSGALNAGIRTTIAPTMLKAGVKDNVLPTYAEAVINLRLFPGDTTQSAIEKVRTLINDDSIVIAPYEGDFGSEAPTPSSTDAQAYKSLVTAIEKSYDGEISVAPRIMIGAADIRHFTHLTDNHYRFIAAELDQSMIDGFHGINERLPETSYIRMIRMYYHLAKQNN